MLCTAHGKLFYVYYFIAVLTQMTIITVIIALLPSVQISVCSINFVPTTDIVENYLILLPLAKPRHGDRSHDTGAPSHLTTM